MSSRIPLYAAAGVIIGVIIEAAASDKREKTPQRLKRPSRLDEVPYSEFSQISQEPEWPDVSKIRICSKCGHFEEDL
jgi:hypothetical protein